MMQRGHAVTWTLAVMFIASTLMIAGLRARSSDLNWEHRAPDRACARWAAESGVARVQARLTRGNTGGVRGKIGEGRYEVSVRATGAGYTIESKGLCGKRPSRWRIRATVAKDGSVVSWSE